MTICQPGSLSDALQLPHTAARHFLTASLLQGAPPQTLHGSLEWAKGASLCRRCVLGQCQLPLHASLLMSAPPQTPLTHISKFATVLIPPRYQTDCHKDVSSPGTARGPSQLSSISSLSLFIYLFFSFGRFLRHLRFESMNKK